MIFNRRIQKLSESVLDRSNVCVDRMLACASFGSFSSCSPTGHDTTRRSAMRVTVLCLNANALTKLLRPARILLVNETIAEQLINRVLFLFDMGPRTCTRPVTWLSPQRGPSTYRYQHCTAFVGIWWRNHSRHVRPREILCHKSAKSPHNISSVHHSLICISHF